MLAVQHFDQRLGEQRKIALALAQRRQRNLKNIQAVIQILAQFALAQRVFEHFVGGRDHAHIHCDLGLSAQPPHAGILQHAQQLGLRAHRHLADFIQQQRAVLRQLETARAPLHRAGERAFFVAEQFALHQRFGQRRAVDGDERTVAPRAK